MIPLLRAVGQRVTALDVAASGVDPKKVDEVHSSDYVEPLAEFMASITSEGDGQAVGHRVTALDVAASGVDPKRVDEVHSLDYVEPLAEFMASIPSEGDGVILVGHSLDGFCRLIAAAVFVAAMMPSPDLCHPFIVQQVSTEISSGLFFERKAARFMDCQFTFGNGLNNPPTSFLLGPNYTSSRLYQLSSQEDVSLATLLMRPHAITQSEEILPRETSVTKERCGSVRRVYIVGDEDKMIKVDFQKWLMEKISTDQVKVIIGSDHMAMLCKPLELCVCLQQITDTYI
ncbi:Alpha/beta hydrolase fold-1 [Dillenia turbinata]|uniref:Alpha/beta hydrolase fold-1 n=1 Tax=Dillenia turbinata TaxID=194707 RepID=A0AAN8UY58_9MAGN